MCVLTDTHTQNTQSPNFRAHLTFWWRPKAPPTLLLGWISVRCRPHVVRNGYYTSTRRASSRRPACLLVLKLVNTNISISYSIHMYRIWDTDNHSLFLKIELEKMHHKKHKRKECALFERDISNTTLCGHYCWFRLNHLLVDFLNVVKNSEILPLLHPIVDIFGPSG